MNTRRFEGKVAFVTGAARGQGRAHCIRLADEGADIIAIDICGEVQTSKIAPSTPHELEETAALVEASGGQVLARQVDVRDLNAMERVVRDGLDAFGDRLDIVVANAGIVTSGRAWELTEEQWRTMIDVNLTGVWNTTKASIPAMIAAGNGGSIVLTNSVAGLRGLPYEAHYSAAKHGLVGLCRALAIELGEFEIRVNTVHPFAVNTPMVTEPDLLPILRSNKRIQGIVATALPKAMQEPEDVAATVAWLSSDEARYVTGVQVPIGSGNQLM